MEKRGRPGAFSRAVSPRPTKRMGESYLVDGTFSLLPDMPEEVVVANTALIQHLELDSGVTLSILCHQIIHPRDP